MDLIGRLQILSVDGLHAEFVLFLFPPPAFKWDCSLRPHTERDPASASLLGADSTERPSAENISILMLQIHLRFERPARTLDSWVGCVKKNQK